MTTGDDGLTHEQILSIEPCSKAFMAASKVRAGPKVISFVDASGQTSISFQRGVTHDGAPDLSIRVTEDVPVTERCSMGHHHAVGRRQKSFGFIQMSWDQAAQFIEWMKDGTWAQVRDRRRHHR